MIGNTRLPGVRVYQKLFGISWYRLSKKFNISYTTILAIRDGRPCSRKNAMKVAQGIGVGVWWLSEDVSPHKLEEKLRGDSKCVTKGGG